MDAHRIISTILRHDQKQNSYKIALLRSIGDVVLSFPGLAARGNHVAVPLRILAEYWVAYYWPFVSEEDPILQGVRAKRGDAIRQDMTFRAELAALRREWERSAGSSDASDGFLLIHELRIPRRRKTYSRELCDAYERALRKITRAIRQPIQYAGPENWTVFERPRRASQLPESIAALPGTSRQDYYLVVSSDLWQTFHELSLWVEALCIHEWCLFTETVRQSDGGLQDRGRVYTLLTSRPDNRRPLAWEHNQIDILIMEGRSFVCPWTEKAFRKPGTYDLDHLLPVSVYPINELWNLVPCDRHFNQKKKRDKLPSSERLLEAEPRLRDVYAAYLSSPTLGNALRSDVQIRFREMPASSVSAAQVAHVTVHFIDQVASVRNLTRF